MSGITVVIPTLPARLHMLGRALDSVEAQVLRPTEIVVEQDIDPRTGAPATRQRGLDRVTTEWVAFLDDDDEFMPHHLAALMDTALTEQADYVYGWYEVVGGTDPFPEFFGLPWDPEQPHQTTITTLVRTELAREAGGFAPNAPMPDPSSGYGTQEDWLFTLRCNHLGKIVHRPERTWRWHHHGGNTSGQPTR